MIKKEKSEYVIQTVGHALDVLEAFHGTVDELGITDLSNHLKLPKNKIYRLLATLESHNFIEQNKAGANYRLGLKNLQMGQTFVKQTGLLRQARPVLESLTGKCGETSYVSILKGFESVYLDAVESELPVRVVSRVGATLPFHCTAAGKVLASGMNETKLREYLSSAVLSRYTSKTIIDPDVLAKHLRRVAELGYAVNDEEIDVGVKCVGAPIRDYTQQIVGAVSISAPTMRFSATRMKKELIPLVKEAADSISAKLGYRGFYASVPDLEEKLRFLM